MTRLKKTVFMRYISEDKNRRTRVIAGLLIKFNNNSGELSRIISENILKQVLFV